MKKKNKWLVFLVYSILSYTLSLRGSEGLLIDLGGLIKYQEKESEEYFFVTLFGTVKREHHDCCHILPCCNVTSSGIQVKTWVRRLMEFKKEKDFVRGPAISDTAGQVLYASDIDDSLHEILEDLFDTQRNLFPSDLNDKEDLRTSYQAFRSFRRTSATRANDQGLREDDINIVNRWHAIEKAAGSRPSFSMRLHYTQYDLLLQPFLRYTKAM